MQGHITSLNPIRPANLASELETEVLKSFENNPEIFHERAMEGGKPVLHFMRPLKAEKSCLKCHAPQGYKVGEILGGVSVTVPMSEYQQAFNAVILKTDTLFATLWFAVITLIVSGLAAGMAHEINNPLAEKLGHAQNIQKRLLSDMPKNKSVAAECGISLSRLQQYLDKRQIPKMIGGILESGNRAASIVSNMLNFSRKSETDSGLHRLYEFLDKTIDLAANDYNLKKEYDFGKMEIVRRYEDNAPLLIAPVLRYNRYF